MQDTSHASTILATAALTLCGVVSAGAVGYMLGYTQAQNNNDDDDIYDHTSKAYAKKVRCLSARSGVDVKVQPTNKTTSTTLVDVRIDQIRPLVPPACLVEELPNEGIAAETVLTGRQGVSNILNGIDDRLVHKIFLNFQLKKSQELFFLGCYSWSLFHS